LEEVNATSVAQPKKLKTKNLMTYLIALFVPPLYFIIKKKWLAFFVTGFLFFLSPFFLITGLLAPVALFFWFVSAICAVWDLRKSLVREHAAIFAEELAEKMGPVIRQQQSTPTPPRL
jgi:hypothetical protein